ncbi:MAG: YybS family protein, partial [Bdellovibrionales bacterium]|nr:YybS family protein [Bdellovibrionales bacterium]
MPVVTEHGLEQETKSGPFPESSPQRGSGLGSRRVLGGALLFLFSAALYLSIFLSILAPIPLIWAHLVRGRSFALMVTLINSAAVFVVSKWTGLAGYFIFSVATGWALAEFARVGVTRRNRSHQGIAKNLFWLLITTSVAVLSVILFAVALWSKIAHVAPWSELNQWLDWFGQEMLKHAPPGSMDAADWAVQKEEWLRNFPSNLIIAVFIQTWVALTLMLRINPSRIRER